MCHLDCTLTPTISNRSIGFEHIFFLTIKLVCKENQCRMVVEIKSYRLYNRPFHSSMEGIHDDNNEVLRHRSSVMILFTDFGQENAHAFG